MGDSVNQLLAYLDEAGPTEFAEMTAEIWVMRASDNVMPADVAAKVSELALAAYAHC